MKTLLWLILGLLVGCAKQGSHEAECEDHPNFYHQGTAYDCAIYAPRDGGIK